MQTWAKAKQSGKEGELLKYYANDFAADGKDLTQFSQVLRAELAKLRERSIQLSDVSLIRWADEAEVMVATFGEVAEGEKSGRTVRQYWQLRNNAWKIIFEGVVS